VKQGPANQSYGLQVAKLAGLPTKVIEQATMKLQQLEETSVRLEAREDPGPFQQMSLFDHADRHPAVELLESIKPDEINPKQALDLLYQLKDTIKRS
jgi:DNA mismatch repair protein MutS